MRIFMFAASVRKESLNKKLINLSANLIKDKHEIDLANFREFEMPLYDGDLNAENGLPESAKQFIARMHKADGIIISSPEYNFSMPGTLKNLIDWVSRETPMPWKNQQILLMSASPALVGGNRGLWNTRVPLESCGAFVYPEMFSLASASTAFNETGELLNETLHNRLKSNLEGFLSYLEKFKK